MIKKIKFFATLLLMLCSASQAWGISFTAVSPSGHTLNYYGSDGNTVSVRPGSYSGGATFSGSLIIPGTVTYNGVTYTVTGIDDYCFQNCSGLTSVSLPNTIVWIGFRAFKGCQGLTSVTIPSSVTYINGEAFLGCIGLDILVVPSSVTTIGWNAFSHIKHVFYTGIAEDEDGAWRWGMPVWGAIKLSRVYEDGLYYADTAKTILNGADSSVTNLVIPATVTKVVENAFRGHVGITSVDIPSGVTYIYGGAFACPNLVTVNYNAVNANDTLGVPFISTGFPTVNGDYYYWSNDTVRASSITTCIIGNSVQTIPADFMSGISSLNSLTIGSNVTIIGNSAFSSCAGLSSVTIPSSVTTIQEFAFTNCSGLTSVTIGSGVTSIGLLAFDCNVSTLNWNCTSCSITYYYGNNGFYTPFGYWDYEDDSYSWFAPITTLNIGDGVQDIPDWMMYNMSTLQHVEFPSSLRTIGQGAFMNSGITGTLTIPASVEQLGSSAFYGTDITTLNYNAAHAHQFNDFYFDDDFNPTIFGSVAHINIGTTVDSIPANLLYGDSALTTLTIPENVRYVGAKAFACPNLTTLNWNARRANNTTDSWSSINIFSGGSQYKAYISNLTIGDQVEYIPNSFLDNDTALTEVSFPASLKNIGRYAFSGTKLTSVTIPASLDSLGDGAFRTYGTLTQVNYQPANLYYPTDGDGAFSFYSGSPADVVQTLILSNGVRSIPGRIFRNMNITSLALPDSLESIGNYAFAYCRQLQSLLVPDRVTAIGRYSFSGDTAMHTVVIGDGVTTIEESAFGNCGITRLVLGESVSNIGSYAFEGMIPSDTVFIRATVPPTITAHTFEDVPTNARIMVPCGTLQDYQDAPYWNIFTRMAEVCGSEPGGETYIVTVSSDNPTKGTALVNGSSSVTVRSGETVTLTATPNEGFRFVRWNDNDTNATRTVIVNGNMTFTAFFDTIGGTEGISTVEMLDAKIYQRDGRIVVESGDGSALGEVRVFDVAGRMLTHSSVSPQGAASSPNLGEQLGWRVTFEVPTSGTYIVKIGDHPARKIVVIR